MRVRHWRGVAVVAVLAWAGATQVHADVNWSTVPVVQHKDFQAVNANGSPAYSSSGFPLRLRGVVLNNTEDWLDPTPAYTSTYQPYNLGGQAEVFVQAVNLDGTAWDSNPTAAFNDFGGTCAWIGQNYGNLPMHASTDFNYTNAQWMAELARLNWQGGTGVTDPIRAGDLIEIRGRVGLHYAGKYNVNEQHDTDPANDFEIVLLQPGYGLPAAAELSLSDLKNGSNQALFDATRATGGEHYQSSRVELKNVRLTEASLALWGINKDLTITDDTGRTLGLHLGYNPSFASTLAPTGYFDVTGILDQKATDPNLSVDGYRLLAMNAADFVVVPEPASISLIALAATGLLLRRRRNHV